MPGLATQSRIQTKRARWHCPQCTVHKALRKRFNKFIDDERTQGANDQRRVWKKNCRSTRQIVAISRRDAHSKRTRDKRVPNDTQIKKKKKVAKKNQSKHLCGNFLLQQQLRKWGKVAVSCTIWLSCICSALREQNDESMTEFWCAHVSRTVLACRWCKFRRSNLPLSSKNGNLIHQKIIEHYAASRANRKRWTK